MKQMLDLIAGIERMMNLFLPDVLFIKETMKLFEAMLNESNSLFKQDVILFLLKYCLFKSPVDRASFSEYV